MASMRLSAEERREIIVKTAVKIAKEKGILSVTHMSVAEACPANSSKATVRWYFPTQTELRQAACENDVKVMKECTNLGIL